MLFKDAQLAGIRDGSITVSFRYWKQPRVRVGGVYRIRPDLAIRVTGVAPFAKRPSAADATCAGFETPAALQRALGSAQGRALYRVTFERCDVPADPRVQLARSTVTDETTKGLAERLAAMDRRSADGAWTRAVLDLIARHPARRAADLAALLNWPTADFKQRVRRLKSLGLTLSLETGYQLSPLGVSFVAATPSRKNTP